MKQKIYKILALALGVASLSWSAPASAAAGTGVKRLADGSYCYPIYREITGVDTTINATFNYALELVEGNADWVSDAPTAATVEFVGVKASAGEDRVAATGCVDFSTVRFQRVGDYKFLLREVSSSDEVNFPVDSRTSYEIEVNVRNALNPDGSVSGEISGVVVERPYSVEGGYKADRAAFASSAKYAFIVFSKKVEGNLADTQEFFEFEVEINGLVEGDELHVYGYDSETGFGGTSFADTGEKFIAGQVNTFRLRHGQGLAIGYGNGVYELPIGVSYSINENDDSGDYQVAIDGSFGARTGVTKVVQARGDYSYREDINSSNPIAASNLTRFTNRRDGNVSTGVNTNVGIFIALGSILAVAMAAVFVVNRKK